MNRRVMLELIQGRRRGPAASAARMALSLAAGPYSAAMRLRRWGYRRGLLASAHGPVPAICVGNITTGGTGKTPMVAYVAGVLETAGHHPAILTRGYRSHEGLSDEAEMLKSLTGLPVIVGADRLASAHQAARLGCDVCVLDDGFQHRRLRRQLDVVLVDATDPFGGGHCLPRGLLREPPAALADAHVIVITRRDQADPHAIAALKAQLKRLSPTADVHQADHRPKALIDPAGQPAPLDALAGKRVLAFCGLGNPQPFFLMLQRLGAEIAATVTLDDHAHYEPGELAELDRQAAACDAQAAVTTQKDAVKISPDALATPLWQLAVQMEIVEDRERFEATILSAAGPPEGTIAAGS